MKIKVTPDLIEKAAFVFKTVKNGVILTGQGLSRQELRALEREGTVRMERARLKKSGSVHNAWHINPSFGKISEQGIKDLKGS